MYVNTVVSANECGMNIKRAKNFTRHLLKSCGADKAARELLETHLASLESVEKFNSKSQEQCERNALFLDNIKARLSETAPKRTVNTYRKRWAQ